MSKYEGTVQNGRFQLVSGEVVRVTTIRPQEAKAPQDLDLGDDGSKLTIGESFREAGSTQLESSKTAIDVSVLNGDRVELFSRRLP